MRRRRYRYSSQDNGRRGYRKCLNCAKQYPIEKHFIIRLVAKTGSRYAINVCENCQKVGDVKLTMEKGTRKQNLLK